MSRRPVSRLLLAGGAALALAACQSPEGKRVRGGPSRGADPNNRDLVVEMHGGSRMFYDTPCLMPTDECTGPLPASGLPGDFPEPDTTENRRS